MSLDISSVFPLPEVGLLELFANFFRFSKTPAKVPDMAQWVGEQNKEVLRTVGYTDAEIDALAANGTINSPKFG